LQQLMEIKMLAPRKSLRPKARKKSIYGVGEKSTQSPDGMTIAEREAAARNEARRKDALEGRAARRAGRKIGSDASAASSSRMKKEEQESQDIFNMLMDGAAEMDKKAYGGKMKKAKKMASGGKMKKVKKMNMGGKCRGMGSATRGGNYKMG
jgi:hypothetical protein